MSGVTMDIDMKALANPDFLPGGTPYAATGSDAQACGANPSDTVMVGFVAYNETCRFHLNYTVPFETWIGDHEATHMANAVTYIQQYQHPNWDARAGLENLVDWSSGGLEDDAIDLLEDLSLCIQRAAATHGHLGGILTGFPGTPITTWWWNASQRAFVEREAGYLTWGAGENPFTTPCF